MKLSFSLFLVKYSVYEQAPKTGFIQNISQGRERERGLTYISTNNFNVVDNTKHLNHLNFQNGFVHL